MTLKRRPIVVRRSGATPVGTSAQTVGAGPGDRVTVKVVEQVGSDVQVALPGGQVGVIEAGDFRSEVPAVGAEVEATYLLADDAGVAILTAREVSSGPWDHLQRGDLVVGEVREMNRGGLSLAVAGARGFAPLSQLGRGGLEAVPTQFQRNRFAGEVVNVDPKKKEIRVGLRSLLERREDARRQIALSRLSEGQTTLGKIVRLNQHGAFVELGGVEGLLHESKILRHVKEAENPAKIEVGEEIEVEVLHVDPKRGRVALGLRLENAEPTSWVEQVADYQVGESVTALIHDVRPDGCSVLLDENVIGWVPNEQLQQVGFEPRKGALVTASIEGLDEQSRRVRLSVVS